MKKQKTFWLWSILAAVGLIVLIGATSSAYPAAESDAAPAANSDAQTGQPPVVLVHGLCGTDDWGLLEQTLNQQGITTAAVDFRGVDGPYTNGDIKIYAQELDSFIQKEFPGQQVDIVAHSMGGLISRYYITSDDYAGNVRKLITLGTPNGGSWWGRIQSFGTAGFAVLSDLTVNAAIFSESECFMEYDRPAFKQMRPGSNFLQTLNSRSIPGSVDIHTIIGRDNSLMGFVSAGDSFVSVKSTRLKDYPLYQTLDTHISYTDNPDTVALVLTLLHSQSPPTAITWQSFEYWPVSDETNAPIQMSDVADQNFLRNNVVRDFGFERHNQFHFGITAYASYAQHRLQVIMPMSGTVKYISSPGFSHCDQSLVIEHPEKGIYTRYFPLSEVYISEGEFVQAGEFIGATSGPQADCSDASANLDFQVLTHFYPLLDNRAASYLNPLAFYPQVNFDTPEISQLNLSDDFVPAPIPDDTVEGEIVQVGSQDMWLAFRVLTVDRDIDDVSIWIDDSLKPLYRFDYYLGTSQENASTDWSGRGFASTRDLDIGQPSEDWFYYHLYAPTDVAMQALLEDGQPHTIYIRAYDVFGNMDEVSFQIELVQ
jgi:pimeloyl-ACP methyl ester carboxylesterase